MKVSFADSLRHSAMEFHLLRERALYKDIFDAATESMKNYIADIDTGILYHKGKWVQKYVNYDWAQQYHETPHLIFHDFFKPDLLNNYQKTLRDKGLLRDNSPRASYIKQG